jgi:hypothetical protein
MPDPRSVKKRFCLGSNTYKLAPTESANAANAATNSGALPLSRAGRPLKDAANETQR